MYLLLTVLVTANVLSEVVELEEYHLLRCIRNMSRLYFVPKRTVVILVPSYNEDDEDTQNQHSLKTYFGYENMHNYIPEQLHDLEKYPVIMPRASDLSDIGSMRKPVYDKYESYVIFAYGQGISDIVRIISEQVQMLSYHLSWNPRARFVVIPFINERDTKLMKSMCKQLLASLWQWKIVNVVILITPSQSVKENSTASGNFLSNIELYTWFPYQNSKHCTTVHEAILIDVWVMKDKGYFMNNTNLFPFKVKNNLNKCPIIVTTFSLEIVVGKMEEITTNDTSRKITYSDGWEIQFIQLVSDHMNSSLEYLLPPPNNEKWGDLSEDGTFTGLLGDLVYNRADVGFAAWPLHPSLVMVIDPSKIYLTDVWVWWVPCAKRIPRWKSIFMVFAPATWTAGFFSVVFAVLVMVFLAKGEHLEGFIQEWHIYKNLETCFSCVLAVLLGVSVSVTPKTSSLRIFFTSWVWYCLAIATVFQTFLVTFLINPGLQYQMNSFEEIMASGVRFGYNPFIDAIVSDSDDTIRKQRVACHDNNNPPCLDWVAYHNNFSLLCSVTFMDYILTRWYLDEDGKPLICQAGDAFYSTNYVSYMTKGNPLMEHYNRVIGRAIEAGLSSRLLERGMELQRIKAAAKVREVRFVKYYNLSLEHLQGAFLIHLSGLILGLLSFTIELFLGRIQINDNINNTNFK